MGSDTPKPGSTSSEGIASRSFSALKWNYAGTAVRVVSQLIVGIVLARVLGPEPFGLISIAWIVVGFCTLTGDLGVGTALIQRKEVSEQDVQHVLSIVLCVGVVVTGAMFASAGPVASFFHRPDAVPVLQVLSALCVIQMLGQVSASLLKRRLEFRAIQRAQIVSYLLAYVVFGIPLAVGGFGVWSLVAAALVQGGISSAMLYIAAPHSLALRWPRFEGDYLAFGIKVMGSNLSNFTINTVDVVIVGRAFGTVDLGLYSRTLQLVVTPMSALVSNLTAVLTPAYSRGQGNLTAVRNGYVASIGLVALLCAPALLTVAVVPDTVIIGLYGGMWADAAPLLVPLSIATLVTALLALGGPVLTGIGQPGGEFRVQALAAIVMVVAMIAASRASLLVLAWTALGVFLLRGGLITAAALVACEGSWTRVVVALRGPMAVAAVTVALVKGADLALIYLGLEPPGRLVFDLVLGGVAWLGATYLLRHSISTDEIRWLVSRIGSRLPRVIARWCFPAS